MITVYLTNGQQAEVGDGIAARIDAESRSGSIELVCLDPSGNEVGRFKYADVSGYRVSGLAGEHKAIILRLIDEVVNKRRLQDLPDLFAPDFVEHVSVSETHDIEAVRDTYELLFAAFPHAQFTVAAILAEGNLVAVRTTATTENLGPFLGRPPTGRQVTIANIDLYRLSGGKIAEHWGYGNDLGLVQQLGLTPPILSHANLGD